MFRSQEEWFVLCVFLWMSILAMTSETGTKLEGCWTIIARVHRDSCVGAFVLVARQLILEAFATITARNVALQLMNVAHVIPYHALVPDRCAADFAFDIACQFLFMMTKMLLQRAFSLQIVRAFRAFQLRWRIRIVELENVLLQVGQRFHFKTTNFTRIALLDFAARRCVVSVIVSAILFLTIEDLCAFWTFLMEDHVHLHMRSQSCFVFEEDAADIAVK